MRRILFLLTVATVCWVGVALAQQPTVTARLVPSGPVTVGEPVRLQVDILVPTWLLGAPQFPVLEIDGAIATGPGRTLNLTERISGVTWSGVQRSYSVMAIGPGEIEIDPIEIPIRYQGPDSKPADVTLTTRALRFEATVPAEARGLPYFLASTRVTVRQVLDPRTDTLRVGEAIKRTVTTIANDAQAMLLPPLPSPAIEGLGVYADEPVVRNEGGERGSQRTGRRIDAVTYVAEREGEYVLPAFEVAWWDVRSKRVRRTPADSVAIVVVSNPDAVAELPIPVDAEDTAIDEPAVQLNLDFLWWLVPAIFAVFFLERFLAKWAAPRLMEWWQEAEQARRETEASYFGRFAAACRANDPQVAMRLLHAWLNRISTPGRPETLDGLVAESGDPELAAAAAALSDALYGTGAGAGGWQGEPLLRALAQVRAARLRARKKAASEPLPPLNP